MVPRKIHVKSTEYEAFSGIINCRIASKSELNES